MNVVYAGNAGPEIEGHLPAFRLAGTYIEAVFKTASEKTDLVLVDDQTTAGGTQTQLIRQVQDLDSKYAIFRSIKDKGAVKLIDNNIGMPNGRTTIDEIVKTAGEGK